MPHQYRTSRGAIIEWRTSEAEPSTTGTAAPRFPQQLVTRGQGRARIGWKKQTEAPTFNAAWAAGSNVVIGGGAR